MAGVDGQVADVRFFKADAAAARRAGVAVGAWVRERAVHGGATTVESAGWPRPGQVRLDDR